MPFTPETAAEAGQQSGLARRQAIIERAARAQVVDRVVSETEDLAPAALAASLALIEKVQNASAELEIEDPLGLQRMANAAEIVHRISRLASGQSTANVAHAQLTDEERKERMAHLRSIAEANAAARAADAAPPDAE